MLSSLQSPYVAAAATIALILNPIVAYVCYTVVRSYAKRTNMQAIVLSAMILVFYVGLFAGLNWNTLLADFTHSIWPGFVALR